MKRILIITLFLGLFVITCFGMGGRPNSQISFTGKHGLFLAISDSYPQKLKLYLVDLSKKFPVKKRTIEFTTTEASCGPSSFNSIWWNDPVQYYPEKELIVLNLEKRNYYSGGKNEYNAFYTTGILDKAELKQIYKTEKHIIKWVLNPKHNWIIFCDSPSEQDRCDFWKVDLKDGAVEKIASFEFKENPKTKLSLSADSDHVFWMSESREKRGIALYLNSLNLLDGKLEKKLVYTGNVAAYSIDNLSYDEKKFFFVAKVELQERMMIKDLATGSLEEYDFSNIGSGRAFWRKDSADFIYSIRDKGNKRHFMIYDLSTKARTPLLPPLSTVFYRGGVSGLIYFTEGKTIKVLNPEDKKISEIKEIEFPLNSNIKGMQEF